MPAFAQFIRPDFTSIWPGIRSFAPGIALCAAVTAAALLAGEVEQAMFGRAWLEPMVLAILAGALVRSLWTPGARWERGVNWSARYLLETGVVLLGVSVDIKVMAAAGPVMLVGIACIVALAILLSLAICLLLRLPVRMAVLIACGNAICGNSAIAAVAPVIDADGNDVAASIAFTAVLGVLVVLGLPVLGLAFGLDAMAYGALGGLTVYAVPQVLAAAAPFGTTAVQMGTLVKLARVLMLGPVCMVLSLAAPHLPLRQGAPESLKEGVQVASLQARKGRTLAFPWFIAGFIILALMRSIGLVPEFAIAPAQIVATVLTLLSMAALGLGVDIRMVTQAGGRVVAAAVLSIMVLIGLALGFLYLLGMA